MVSGVRHNLGEARDRELGNGVGVGAGHGQRDGAKRSDSADESRNEQHAPKTHLFPQRKNDVFKKTLVVCNEASHKDDRI